MPGILTVQDPETKKPLNGAMQVNELHCVGLCSSGRGWFGNQDVAGMGAMVGDVGFIKGQDVVTLLP